MSAPRLCQMIKAMICKKIQGPRRDFRPQLPYYCAAYTSCNDNKMGWKTIMPAGFFFNPHMAALI